MHDGNAPEAPAPAEYRNGAGGTLGQTEAAPCEAEATQKQETVETARTEATAEAAAGRADRPQRHGPRVPLSGG
ncbi:hypothetical protein [Streptomyces sp. NPDC088812]|uniref:hypothetical protein n=1 Tax=Streptomyces sp. NPDC088812 TaxID=3365905 RepID=UPI003830BD3A